MVHGVSRVEESENRLEHLAIMVDCAKGPQNILEERNETAKESWAAKEPI